MLASLFACQNFIAMMLYIADIVAHLRKIAQQYVTGITRRIVDTPVGPDSLKFITVHNGTDTLLEYRYDCVLIQWSAWRPCPVWSDCTR